jgi:hypothetical protein
LGEFIQLGNNGNTGLYNFLIENTTNRSGLIFGRYNNRFSIGRADSPAAFSLTYGTETAGAKVTAQIGYEDSKREDLYVSSSGYIQTVTGSEGGFVTGSLKIQDVLKIEGSNVAITGSFAMSGSSFSVIGGTDFQVQSTGIKLGNSTADTHQITGSLNTSGSVFMGLTSSASPVNQVVMRSNTTGQLFVTASSAIGGGGAVSSVSGMGGGINVTPTTGDVVITNTGVHTIDVVNDYPLSVNSSTGAVSISTIYTQLSLIFSVTSGTVTVLGTPINNTGDTFTLTTANTGEYNLIATTGTPFTANKTMIQVSVGSNGRTVFANHEYKSDSEINVYIYDDTGAGQDDGISYASLDIKIFQ